MRCLICNAACVDFVKKELQREEVFELSVLEVGACNENGSIRPLVESLKPKKYVGVDIQKGPGVDVICDVSQLTARFGVNHFDVVISTEVLEHIQDWSKAISQLKSVLKPNGVLILTTRSLGCPYHAFPLDFWRYEEEDMKEIFSACSIERLEKDPLLAGVFVKVRKPHSFSEKSPRDVRLYSMMLKRKANAISDLDVFLFRLKAKFPWFACLGKFNKV